MNTVLVIGGGASGMAAAYSASLNGARVILIEQNEKLGKKVYISGKGRCNLTNASSKEELMKNIVTNPKFLYSAFNGFSNKDVMELFINNGCPLKTERGERVFPSSDHASSVIYTFERVLKKNNVEIRLNTKVKELILEDNVIKGVKVVKTSAEIEIQGQKRTAVYKELGKPETIKGDRVIICSGGISYPGTGSTGDGYRFLRETGHMITGLYPALVPLNSDDEWVKRLSGLALKNVSVKVTEDESPEKILYTDFGEMLFTHFGVSGPVILSVSSYITKLLSEGRKCTVFIDLKSALDHETLDRRLIREFEENKNKTLKNVMIHLLPSSLSDEFLLLSGVSGDTFCNSVSKEERKKLVTLLKALPVHIESTRDFCEAIITSGGANVNGFNPRTMESRTVKGLYAAGEVLDLDALTGGFNLQIAWSTGYAAGKAAAI